MEAIPLVIRPMQWELLPDLEETAPLDDQDLACMSELRAVLERHGKLDRFALHLVHRHFDLAPGEVLIERPDPNSRTQHVTVGRMEDVGPAVPTTWVFDPLPALVASTYCVCISKTAETGAKEYCFQHGKQMERPADLLREDALRDAHYQKEQAKKQRRPAREDDGGRGR